MESDDATAVLLRIGRNLKAERGRAGLKQDELAHKASLGVAHLSRIERGQVNSSVTTYVALARALGININELFRDVE
ncbi:MAG: helix-turn-helix transcriptional regulator [Propionibacteriales bacterium]|nr:helix-turn-helix transcriptional regulator [Propionibacteriales bacterium]